ncbi:hypothetical protein KEM55_005493 [Ascosphaera atra]|nr:hypothetical protein KEM55_005493 [Ascosphaera atra]
MSEEPHLAEEHDPTDGPLGAAAPPPRGAPDLLPGLAFASPEAQEVLRLMGPDQQALYARLYGSRRTEEGWSTLNSAIMSVAEVFLNQPGAGSTPATAPGTEHVPEPTPANDSGNNPPPDQEEDKK